MKSIAVAVLFGIIYTVCAHAASKGLKVDVTLTPVGSFQVSSDRLKGKVVRAGGKLKADKITVPVEGLKTGMDLRDEHLHKKLKNGSITIREAVAENGKGTGLININGVEKKFPFTYREMGKDYVEAKFDLSLKEFGLTGLSYMDVGVNDMVSAVVVLPVSE